MRASTRLRIEPGRVSSEPSLAFRNSCSKKRGLPSARSTQASATLCVASMNSPARSSDSRRSSGPRSIVVNGVPPIRERHCRSSGAPSMRDQQRRTVGQGPRDCRQEGEDRRVCPVQVFDGDQQWITLARCADQRCDHLLAAAVAHGIVHGVIVRLQLASLWQIQEVVQKRDLIGRDHIFGYSDLGRRRARQRLGARLDAKQTSHHRLDGILPSADPKIEDQPFMSRKASGPRQTRHFSEQACLADARVTANVD
jgi:hypothetical protein